MTALVVGRMMAAWVIVQTVMDRFSVSQRNVLIVMGRGKIIRGVFLCG